VALPAKTPLLKLEIVEGRDLLPGDTDAIVLNTALAAKRAELAVGKRVVFRIGSADAPMRIVGIAREQFSPPMGYVPHEISGHPGMANSVRIALERTDHASIDDVKTALNRNLEQEGVRTQSTTDTAESRFGFDQHMVMIYVFLVVVSSIIAGIGGLGLMTTMSLNILERRREMGVLRAIGASPSAVWLIVVTEGVVIAVLSWVLAALAAWPFSKALGNYIGTRVFTGGLDFKVELSGLLIWLTVSLVLGTVASLLPAWHASRMTVREALSHS
jgi:putative ABC transport system permease protein